MLTKGGKETPERPGGTDTDLSICYFDVKCRNSAGQPGRLASNNVSRKAPSWPNEGSGGNNGGSGKIVMVEVEFADRGEGDDRVKMT